MATRDYYADLELNPMADVQDIKKQFRKLALKYHPDRNPGREAEVNQKFQIIQSAHEVLSDPEQKAKYDANRARSRYPMASGVRGNPWANAADAFPPPPRRNQSTRTAPSGAQRYQTRFAQGVPPTAKQHNGPNPDLKQNAARAFENMRKQPPEQPRPNPPPPPPRTESARNRAQAAFGTRKTGYHPRSATHGDEPPVSNSNYNTNYNTRPRPPPPERPQDDPEPTPMPDPLRQFREQGSAPDLRAQDSFPRPGGGDKANPFDGVPLGRAKSTREPPRADAPPPDFDTPTRQRSFHAPEKPTEEAVPMRGESPTKIPVDARPKAPLKKTRTGQNFASATASSSAQPPNGPPAAETPTKPTNNATESPSMYATPCVHLKRSNSSVKGCGICRTYTPRVKSHQDDVVTPSNLDRNTRGRPSPSGVTDSPLQLTPFERKQQELLAQLIENAGVATESAEKRHRDRNRQNGSMNGADKNFSDSFSMPVDDETFASPSPKHPKLSTNNVDGINTRFVNDDEAEAWQFSAGGSEQSSPTKPRPPPGSRPGRRSPLKRPTIPRSETSSAASEPATAEPAFDSESWSREFGPHTFQPPPPQAKPASPTRSLRGNSKKGRSAKPSGIPPADNDSSSEEEEELAWPGRKAQQGGPGPVAAESPQAMDIDSPPAKPEAPRTSPPRQTEPPSEARNINVEPSRPEWRPGNGEGVNGEARSTTPPMPPPMVPPMVPPLAPSMAPNAAPVRPPKVPFNANAAGSEDSEEFMANFSELKGVPPFAKQASGLRSFEDLKDTLPFDSRPSGKGPMTIPKPKPLLFPTPPVAPTLPMVAINGRKPHNAAWEKYVAEFDEYLHHWDIFNETVLSHYTTRQNHISNFRKTKGYSFLGARSDADILTYFNWVQQDQEVRKKWTDASEEHEQKIREFMAFRIKMK